MTAQARTLARSRIREVAGAVLVVVLTTLVFLGWFESTVLLGAALAAQLAIGGSLGIALLGRVRGDLGVGRYLTLPLMAVGITLFGRFLRPGDLPFAIVLALLAAAFLWVALQVEMAYSRGRRPKVVLDIVLAFVIFFAAASIGPIIGDDPPTVTLGLVGLLALALAFRSAEARGTSGGPAIGHAFLQAFAVVQVGVALEFLQLPGDLVGPAALMLAFYAWGGAADLLHEGASSWRVFLEYGIFALVAIAIVFIVREI